MKVALSAFVLGLCLASAAAQAADERVIFNCEPTEAAKALGIGSLSVVMSPRDWDMFLKITDARTGEVRLDRQAPAFCNDLACAFTGEALDSAIYQPLFPVDPDLDGGIKVPSPYSESFAKVYGKDDDMTLIANCR